MTVPGCTVATVVVLLLVPAAIADTTTQITLYNLTGEDVSEIEIRVGANVSITDMVPNPVFPPFGSSSHLPSNRVILTDGALAPNESITATLTLNKDRAQITRYVLTHGTIVEGTSIIPYTIVPVDDTTGAHVTLTGITETQLQAAKVLAPPTWAAGPAPVVDAATRTIELNGMPAIDAGETVRLQVHVSDNVEDVKVERFRWTPSNKTTSTRYVLGPVFEPSGTVTAFCTEPISGVEPDPPLPMTNVSGLGTGTVQLSGATVAVGNGVGDAFGATHFHSNADELDCGVAWSHPIQADSDVSEWCFPYAPRAEDGSAILSCAPREEVVWWDDRTDAAVNDLGSVAFTQDDDHFYIANTLWADPDPLSLPFYEIAIDYAPGGLGVWHDPNGVLTDPGHCSVFTDRACTSDADCHFCQISQEPSPSTRVRTCGSGCDPDIGDFCDTNQTCVDLGSEGLKQKIGLNASPTATPDYLIVYDLSLWLISAGDPVMLMQPGAVVDPNPWDPVLGCPPDFNGDTTVCDFPLIINPGTGSSSFGVTELAIPWSAFGCTGCPDACSCPDFGPGRDFRFTMTVARGSLTLDFTPDGAVEDVMSEAAAGTTTTTTNSCGGFGVVTTDCELADGSMDALVPRSPSLPHESVPGGRVVGLTVTQNAAPSITLDWFGSCSVADTDYEVYEGNVGDWYSHARVTGLCTTGGLTSATLNTGPEDHYYLVVPTDGVTEGSYGMDSGSVERPVGESTCAAQALGACP
jgi:hypothetical protein